MISRSPLREVFEYKIDDDAERERIDSFARMNRGRKMVVVQGLGFVGAAMAAVLANARDDENNLLYCVIGVDLADEDNYWKIARVNSCKSPVVSSDKCLDTSYESAFENGNLIATYSEHAYFVADVVVVDVNLDIRKKAAGNPWEYDFNFDAFEKAIRSIAEKIREHVLVIVETTVPPGTTEKVVFPLFREVFASRELDIGTLYLAHSYERVMPGPNYLMSITDFFRVYSGISERSKKRAKEFLESFINIKDFPLFEMHSPTASEMSKVLENTFRSANIALMQEWTEFAQRADVNLFEVLEAIRVRPTHRNIMSPGFGVGGYCLTKDSLLADWAYRNLFSSPRHLDMSSNAIAINDLMPLYTFGLLKAEMPVLKGKHVTLMGVSYLGDVADTRFSPSELFYDRCVAEGATVLLHDSLVTFWPEKRLGVENKIENLVNHAHHDAVIFAVRHREYVDLTSSEMVRIFRGVSLIIDANNIISDSTAEELMKSGIRTLGVGKGHWETLWKHCMEVWGHHG